MKFQDDISNLNTYIHTHTRTSQNQYVPHFFKVGGIISFYRNDPMFSDTWVWAISANPDQTAPRGAV